MLTAFKIMVYIKLINLISIRRFYFENFFEVGQKITNNQMFHDVTTHNLQLAS